MGNAQSVTSASRLEVARLLESSDKPVTKAAWELAARRNRQAVRVARHGRDSEKSVAEDDDAPLTRPQIRELDRLAKDSRDRTRYLLISSFNPRLALYYNVSEDT